MCGICGILDFSARSDIGDLIARMTRSLQHRGPDHSGIFCDEYVGLGHTRLSILDLSANGHQPMADDDDRYLISYNGEVYNFSELRSELEAKGFRFRSRTDTEVVLKSFLCWGIDSLARFKGMFAFSIWDKQRKRLLLARDRFGIKPLYYRLEPMKIVFSSEPKAILQERKFAREINMAALHEYLYFNSSLGEKTIYSDINRLLPGHYLIYDQKQLQIGCYLNDLYKTEPRITYDRNEMLNKLQLAISRHLVADVPIGIFLSGGMDSSTITAIASQCYQREINTFSIGFDCPNGADELPKARQVAKEFSTKHHELVITSDQIPSTIEKLVVCHDEPFGDAADIPLYLLCQNIRGQLKVVLQGDGGDEIFAGYRRYQVLSYEKWWQLVSRLGNRVLPLFPPTPANYRRLRFFRAMSNPDPAMRMALLLTVESLEDTPLAVFSKNFSAEMQRHDPFERYKQLYQTFADLDPVQRMLFVDCQIILPDLYLEKVDKSTMAHGIEVRIPLLDNDLTDYLIGMSSKQKIRLGVGKWPLRHAMQGYLPKQIIFGKKTGFGVPMGWWLRYPLADYMTSVLLDQSTLGWGIFNRSALEHLIQQHLAGRKDNGFLLYRLLNFSIWLQKYL